MIRIITLGGVYGGNWRALAEASRDPIDTSDHTDTGATLHAYSFGKARRVAIADAGVRAGEIVGYRAWAVGHDGFLRSMYAEHTWTPNGVESGDPNQTLEGIHAFKSLWEARRTYNCYSVSGPVAFGAVALWGSVIEHELGYRAEFGAIASIINIRTTFSPYRVGRRPWQFWKPSLLTELRQRYCAPSIKTAE